VSIPKEEGDRRRNVYPKSVLKKSHSVTMGRDHYLSLARPSSSTSYIAPFSEPVVPTWDSPGVANQVRRRLFIYWWSTVVSCYYDAWCTEILFIMVPNMYPNNDQTLDI
jgi:hypothetical protein